MSVTRLTGSWCGVCPQGIARLVDGDVVVSTLTAPAVPLWRRAVGTVRWVDCASHETTGEIRVAYTRGEDGGDTVYVIARTGEPVSLGRGWSVVLRRRNSRWVAMISRGHGRWELVDAETRAVLSGGIDPRWSSAGLTGMTADGKPTWTYRDPVRIGSLTLQHPRRDGDWHAAQGSNPAALLVAHNQTSGVLLFGEAREPKVAALPDGRGAIVSRVEQGYGVAFAILRPEDVASLPTSPVPPPDDDDDSEDEDDDNMSTAQFNALRDALKALQASLASLHAKVETLDEKVDALAGVPVPPDPGPEPEPPSGDAPDIDLRQVTWLHTDVSGWAETSRIDSVGIEYPRNGDPDDGKVCFPHTKAGQWPTFDGGTGEGNVWVFGKVDGKWYAATCEWLKPGQTCKRFSNRTEPDSWGIGPHTKKAPLNTWGPASGEWIGIMVSTRARDGQRSLDANGQPVLERSNVAMVRWP